MQQTSACIPSRTALVPACESSNIAYALPAGHECQVAPRPPARTSLSLSLSRTALRCRKTTCNKGSLAEWSALATAHGHNEPGPWRRILRGRLASKGICYMCLTEAHACTCRPSCGITRWPRMAARVSRVATLQMEIRYYVIINTHTHTNRMLGASSRYARLARGGLEAQWRALFSDAGEGSNATATDGLPQHGSRNGRCWQKPGRCVYRRSEPCTPMPKPQMA